MLREFRRRMTWFCALATGAILVCMSLLCLFLSESAIREGQYRAFLKDLDSVITYLEGQTVIPAGWASRLESRDQMYLTLYDRGKRALPSGRGESALDLLEEIVRNTAAEDHGLDILAPAKSGVEKSEYVHFPVRVWNMGPSSGSYYAAAAVFPKEGGDISAIILYSLERQQKQIVRQRWMFAGVGLMGLIALCIFAWVFTGKLVGPMEQSRRNQVQFVASAAHELRSPLTVMLSNLSALEKAGEDERGRFQDNIRAEGLRMSRLVNDLLVLANTDSHSWSILSAPTEMDTLCLDVYERFCGPAREKGLRLTVALPEGELPVRPCDPDRIAQALSVLLDNAISYTPAGGTVSLSLTKQGGDKVRFSVTDTGPGVPDGEKEKIFQRFYRTDRQDKEHFGLGLCVAKEIVQLHRGRIWVEDAPGGGAAFYMVL